MTLQNPMSLTLNLLGLDRDLPVEELEPRPSPHTGRPLRHVRVRFRAPAVDSGGITDALGQARDAKQALSASDGSRWVVASSSYSYADGDRRHLHEAELREVEEIRAERLELLGLTLVPTWYKEDVEDGLGIVISARVDPGPVVEAALEREVARERDDDMYFDVRRAGVADTPIRMRFGRCLWQKTDHGRAHLLRLVSETGDSEERRNGLRAFLREPEFSVAARKAATAQAGFEASLEELWAVGALDGEAVKRIRGRVEQSLETGQRQLDEARELERFF